NSPHIVAFFNTSPISYTYTLSLHDALPILVEVFAKNLDQFLPQVKVTDQSPYLVPPFSEHGGRVPLREEVVEHLREAAGVYDLEDRKSTRLNSSHVAISYAVFCLKKKSRYYDAANESWIIGRSPDGVEESYQLSVPRKICLVSCNAFNVALVPFLRALGKHVRACH